MKMISFWRDAKGYLYIEKVTYDALGWVSLTESEITDMLAYIEQNMPELWLGATHDRFLDGYDYGVQGEPW